MAGSTRRLDSGELESLFAEALAGSDDAWTTLLDRHRSLIMATARRFGLTGADADDLFQTVALRLLEHRDRIRSPRALPGWVSSTAQHECLRVVRCRDREPSVERIGERPGAMAASPEPDERLVRDLSRRAVREALASLGARERELLILSVATDPRPSYAEIAGRLGLAVGSIGPTRGRCLAKLAGHPAIRAIRPSVGSAAA
ncbi:MAG: sigma-70 family RNA polymerase sigma factor [Actinomycetota bacterium]|nr:sigma-70 family RNA polymerase sigma factor [Actinomycetota bacterium]